MVHTVQGTHLQLHPSVTPISPRLVSALEAKHDEEQCRLTPVCPVLEVLPAWFHFLKPKYEEPLSNFAFNFQLRRYGADSELKLDELITSAADKRSVDAAAAKAAKLAALAAK